jgi:hypothetical protein
MKQMNLKLLLPVFLITAITAFYGCDNLNVGNAFLKKPPEVKSTRDTVFSHAKYTKQFLTDIYRTLPYGTLLEKAAPYDHNVMGDDPLANITDAGQSYGPNGGCLNWYYNGAYSAAAENNAHHFADFTKYNFYNSGAWVGIRNAWLLINNIDKVPDMDAQTKKEMKGEAYLIMAIHYVDLFRNYGGMMWVGHAYTPNENFHNPRMTAMATLDSTLMLIDKASKDLPFTLTNPAQNSGRLTQAAAMGLKVRLLLFAASPLFNSDRPYLQGEAADKKLVWYGSKHPELWKQAADAAKAFIDKNQQEGMPYHLANTGNPRKDFLHAYYDRSSPEILISTRKVYKAPIWPNFLVQRGNLNVTNNYVRMFPMANGKPITDPTSGYDPQHPFKNRDPRLYETVLINGDNYQGRTAELYFGGKERKSKQDLTSFTGYRARKFVLDITTAEQKVVQWPYLRLPEIYLSYAEALDMENKGPTAEAYEYVNKVRHRVGLGDLKTGLNQKQFRMAVLQERAREFGYENVRWFDIIRWKMSNIFTEQLYGMNICKDGVSDPSLCGASGYDGKTYLYQKFPLKARYWKNHFSPKWYLSAFPKDEILKGYGVIQNPGW